MKKTIFSLVILMLVVALPTQARMFIHSEPGGGGGGSVNSPVVAPVPEVSGGGGGGGSSYLVAIARVTSGIYQTGNKIQFLGSKWGYAYLEYEDGTQIWETEKSVFHTLYGKSGKATLWYVGYNQNGYEFEPIWVGEVEIK